MTFKIITLGCKVNQYESQVMTEIMLKDGFSLVQEDDSADIFIINTCKVTVRSRLPAHMIYNCCRFFE